MKTLFTIIMLFVLSVQIASAQKIDTAALQPPLSKHDMYNKKFTRRLIIATVLLVPGVVMTVVGFNQSMSNLGYFFFAPENGNYNSSSGEALMLTGTVMVLTSIPFFISAGIAKRKAHIALKNENVAMPGRYNFNYPAVSLKIQF